MKRALMVIAAALVLTLAGLTDASAARKMETAAKAGEEVKTDYFAVTIPNGWIMAAPVKKQPNNGVSTVFATESGNMAVTINVMPAPLGGKEIAEQTAKNMNKSGLKTTPPEEKDGLWLVNIDGKGKKGVALFGSNGKLCSVTIIFGAKLETANELFKNIKADDPALFPKSI